MFIIIFIFGCSDPICSDSQVTAECVDATTRASCLNEGGCWGTWGLSAEKACNCPTNDAGTSCSSNNDCEGICLAYPEEGICPESGECSEMMDIFGCYCDLSTGDEICVD